MGYNWRLSEPHAIIGLRHLERLPAMIADRRRIAAIYDAWLGTAGAEGVARLRPLAVPPGGVCNYYEYIAVIEGGGAGVRAAIKRQLKERHGVALSGEVYESPLHAQPVFREVASAGAPLPVADDLCARHVCLPVFSGMEDADAEQVLRALGAVMG
jgi:perosamine synthetase